MPQEGRRISELRSSQKFFAGDVEQLPELEALRASDFPRAPYPQCAFEMVLPVLTKDIKDHCICLAFDSAEAMAVSCYQLCHNPFEPQQKTWLWFAALGINRISNQYRFAHPLGDGTGALGQVVSTDVLTPFSGEMVLTKDEDWLSRSLIFNLGLFLAVLNCVNVKTETVEAPERLNKKRERNGKLPIYSYKTLVLRPPAARRADGGGTHESPRVHLRRGHIKRRKTGNFWWQPCVVGDPRRGVVMKDYRADELIAA